MPLTRPPIFSRLVAEFSVIVVGVLVALAIEAGWSERQERIDEQDAIQMLRVEFQSNAARLDTVAAQHREGLEAGYALLGLMDEAEQGRAPDLPAPLLFDLVEVWTYDPINGGLNSLIASGRLGILENEALRAALAGWPDIVADLRENEEEEWANTYQVLNPFFMDLGVWEDVLLASGRLRRIEPEPGSADISPLLRNPRFRQHVANRVMNLHNLLDEVVTVEEAIEAILDLLNGS